MTLCAGAAVVRPGICFEMVDVMRMWLSSEHCHACERIGHIATSCDDDATRIHLRKGTKFVEG